MRYPISILALSVLLYGCSSPVEDAVRADLIDPDSAQFRDLVRCEGDQRVWRGEVNAKNRMGAFTGYEPYFYDGVSVAFASDSSSFSAQMERCFSNLSSDTDAATEDSSAPDIGKWMISSDTNPLDDSKTTIASIDADEGASRFDGPVRLVARCQSNKTEVYVVWHEYLGDDSQSVYEEWKYVDVRVGEQKSQRQRWSISTDRKATFSPSAINLLKSMSSESRMVLQTTPYNESPMIAVFDLTGAGAAIKQVAETCNWKV